MYCMNCAEHIEECTCPEKEEKLIRVADMTAFVVPVFWCLLCKRPQSCCPHAKDEVTHFKMGGRIVRKLDITNPLTGKDLV